MAKRRRLVVCCDGTWNDDQSNTHVCRIKLAVAGRDRHGVEQRVYYDQGVGTAWHQRLRGGILGWGLSQNVRDAYAFLVDTYREGDEVFCFGFSRGAYTVRSLCGFLKVAGLLDGRHRGLIDEAYRYYRLPRDERAGSAFHRTLAGLSRRPIGVRFLGVFDTVGSLGVPLPWLKVLNGRHVEFHDTGLSDMVETACQALAIDERRDPYRPTLWTSAPGKAVRADGTEVDQTVLQVWVPGAHSDVGGGYDEAEMSEAERGYAAVPLRWMVDRAEACGLAFDEGHTALAARPNPAGRIHDSLTWGWKLVHGASWSLGAYDRPIGNEQRRAAARARREPWDERKDAVGAELVHACAFDRIEGAAAGRLPKDQRPYAPPSLVAGGRPRPDVAGVGRFDQPLAVAAGA